MFEQKKSSIPIKINKIPPSDSSSSSVCPSPRRNRRLCEKENKNLLAIETSSFGPKVKHYDHISRSLSPPISARRGRLTSEKTTPSRQLSPNYSDKNQEEKVSPRTSQKIGQKFASHISIEDLAFRDPRVSPLPPSRHTKRKCKQFDEDISNSAFVVLDNEINNNCLPCERDRRKFSSIYKEEKWMPPWFTSSSKSSC